MLVHNILVGSNCAIDFPFATNLITWFLLKMRLLKHFEALLLKGLGLQSTGLMEGGGGGGHGAQETEREGSNSWAAMKGLGGKNRGRW